MGLWSRLSSTISNGWNKGRNAISKAVNATKSGIGNAYNAAKRGLGKAYNVGKDFASKHAETIGTLAGGALMAYNPALASFAAPLAKHLAHDKSGFGRAMKGFSNPFSKLSSQLESQSEAKDVSNGHVATGYGGGYSISTSGNNTKPVKRYSGYHNKQSRVL